MIPQYIHFRCGRVHINTSLRNKSISYKLQPSLLKQELEHDEIYEDTWEDKEHEWLPCLKMCHQFPSPMLGMQRVWKN